MERTVRIILSFSSAMCFAKAKGMREHQMMSDKKFDA